MEQGELQEQGISIYSMERKRKSSIGNRIFVHHRTVSAVKRVEFISDRVSRTVLGGRYCNIIVVNVHAQNEGEGDDSKEDL